jgi:hypothetical protein
MRHGRPFSTIREAPVTLAAFNGHEALTFTDYTDLNTGRTLHAEPGGTYDVAPASGRVVPEFPEPWFTRIQPAPEDPTEVQAETVEPAEAGGVPAEGDSAPGSSSGAGGEPGGEDEHSAF